MVPDQERRRLVFAAIADERARQDARWARVGGNWDEPAWMKYLVLAEEVGELAHGMLGTEGLADGLLARAELDVETVGELLQVAAVAVAWLESLPWAAVVDADEALMARFRTVERQRALLGVPHGDG